MGWKEVWGEGGYPRIHFYIYRGFKMGEMDEEKGRER